MQNSERIFALLDRIFQSYSQFNPFFNFLIPEARGNPIEPLIHQVEIASRLLFREPIRILIADEIGLGKTITAIALHRKLAKLGRANRVLILVPRILINQWITELRRTGIERGIRRIERHTIRSLAEQDFPQGCYIASMDLVKRDEPPYRYYDKVQQVPWDLIIIDEAHRLGLGTERLEKIGKLIGNPNTNVLMLTATPHRGIPEDYLARLTALDPYLVKGDHLNSREFYSLTHNVTVFRRRKEEVNKIYEKREIFQPCDFNALIVQATKDEENFQQRLMRFLRTKILDYYEKMQEPPKAIGLLTTVIFKRATSSPYAAIRTLENVIKKRAVVLTSKTQEEIEARLSRRAKSLADSIFGFGFEDYDEEDLDLEPDEQLNKFAEECSSFLNNREVKELAALCDLARKIQEKDSRLNAVLEYVRYYVSKGRKIVMFSEFKDTVNYVFDALVNTLGSEAVVKLTSEQSRREDEVRKIRQKFEKNPRCMVLVASDVASEGLNLQVASILINYEITWSPVKLEQRVGRVWRLGQKEKVDAFTVLLTAGIDNAALDVIYKKLLELHKATTARPIVGEYVLVLDMREKTDTSRLPLVELSKGKRKIKATEYELLSTYVRGGKQALAELVDNILITLKNLNDELNRSSVFPQADPNLMDELISRTTGFKRLQDLEKTLRDLLNAIIPFAQRHLQISYARKPTEVTIIIESGAPQTLTKHHEFFDVIDGILQKLPKESIGIPCIVTFGDKVEDLYIAEASVLCDSEPIYSEPIGILIEAEEYDRVEILRGTQLLGFIIKALSNLAAVPNEHITSDIPNKVRIKAKGIVEDLLRYVSSEYLRYIQEPYDKGWRDSDKSWLPKLEIMQTRVSEIIGVIKTTIEGSKSLEMTPNNTSPLRRKVTEKQAMKIALEYEKTHGRQPMDVSDYEHYDIQSTCEKTNRIRYIEVKGHDGRAFTAELTEPEYTEAKKKKKAYWLYIVYNTGKENPEMIAIKDPLRTMNLKIINEPRYRLAF